MKTRIYPISLLLVLLASGMVYAQATEKRYFMHETSGFAFTPQDYRVWKAEVPYKQPVRLVSELFDFPSEWNSARETDLTIQLYEYVMKTNPEAIRKMRLHSNIGFHITKIYPTNKSSEADHVRAMTEAKKGNRTYEIILVKGFKYVPDKYLGPNPGKKSPLYTEAMSILNDPK